MNTCVQGSLDCPAEWFYKWRGTCCFYHLSNIILCQDMNIYKAYAKAKLILLCILSQYSIHFLCYSSLEPLTRAFLQVNSTPPHKKPQLTVSSTLPTIYLLCNPSKLSMCHQASLFFSWRKLKTSMTLTCQ